MLLVLIWDGSSATAGLPVEDKSTTVEQVEAREMTGVRRFSLFQGDFYRGRRHLLHSLPGIQEKVDKFEEKDEEIHLSSWKGSSWSLWMFGQTEKI